MTSQSKVMTVDELIESALADRKILLFRYDAHLRQKTLKKLTALQRQLINRLASAGIESISKKELNQLLKDIRQAITETYAEVGQECNDELDKLLPIETQATTEIYNNAVKFDLFNTVTENRIKAVQSAPIIAGVPLEDWWQKQGDDLAFKFSGLIRQGMLDGKPTGQLITESKALLSTSRRWAETLVRTAVMKVHDKAQELVRDENRDIIKGEQHISTLDLRTSSICRARDGKAWDLDKKPIGDHNLPYARPPLHPNCRSTMRLLTKSWRELGIDVDELPESTRASMDGQVKATMHYEDWLKTKSPEEQDRVLGKGKADLWRRGVITFADMLDQSGRSLTLKELSASFDPHFILPEVNTRTLKKAQFTQAQLSKKYLKHAAIFRSLDANKSNPKSWKALQNAIIDHLNNENTRQFGTYGYAKNSKVFYNDKSGIAVIMTKDNHFLSAFIPEDREGKMQLTNYLKNGYLR